MNIRIRVEMTKAMALIMVRRSRFFCTIWVPAAPPMEEPPKRLDMPPPLPECNSTKTIMEILDTKKTASMMYFSISTARYLLFQGDILPQRTIRSETVIAASVSDNATRSRPGSTDDSRKVGGLEARAAHEGTVDILHGHELGRVIGLYAAAVEYAHGSRGIVSISASQPAAY